MAIVSNGSLNSQEGALCQPRKAVEAVLPGGLESSLKSPSQLLPLIIVFSSFLQLSSFIAFLFLTPLSETFVYLLWSLLVISSQRFPYLHQQRLTRTPLSATPLACTTSATLDVQQSASPVIILEYHDLLGLYYLALLTSLHSSVVEFLQ